MAFRDKVPISAYFLALLTTGQTCAARHSFLQ
ncbi:predicted protein [Sclerotinia sclerotiorum 1980 UF-70]|uniref:Uncharacterized protein n=1 Tax=Sclerotinia sclerotiorum (strain ATCC 18683 / 1980 / Ss-1) TaxID=665079 RepID=A7E9F6_SCLS1|nr:predicted protein [Sclerotinia sclerotiorum 1980 UF-70]EDN97008.1 predicted protein [Sclerotinia sclerotiorum 1980 UF-70]